MEQLWRKSSDVSSELSPVLGFVLSLTLFALRMGEDCILRAGLEPAEDADWKSARSFKSCPLPRLTLIFQMYYYSVD